MHVLAEVRKRRKISATTNESNKGSTTADSNKGHGASARKSLQNSGATVTFNKGNVSGSAISRQEHVYFTFRLSDGGIKNFKNK